MPPHFDARGYLVCAPPQHQLRPGWTSFHHARRHINTVQRCSGLPQFRLIFISPSLFHLSSSATSSATPPMNTRPKNKSKHPGFPDMTPSQRSSAGLSRTSQVHRSSPKKPSARKPTKDQQIAALESQLRTARELLTNVSNFLLHVH